MMKIFVLAAAAGVAIMTTAVTYSDGRPPIVQRAVMSDMLECERIADYLNENAYKKENPRRTYSSSSCAEVARDAAKERKGVAAGPSELRDLEGGNAKRMDPDIGD